MNGWTVVKPLFFVYIPRRCKNWIFCQKFGGRSALSKTSQAFLKENHGESQIEINSQAGSSLKGTLSDKIFRRMENSFHFKKEKIQVFVKSNQVFVEIKSFQRNKTRYFYFLIEFLPLLRQLYCWSFYQLLRNV